jgi:integral membrane sensor domain MASE1
MTPARRLLYMRRLLWSATPFAIIGALYIAGRNQVLGLLLIVAFFVIAVRFARAQDKAEAQIVAAEEVKPDEVQRESA